MNIPPFAELVYELQSIYELSMNIKSILRTILWTAVHRRPAGTNTLCIALESGNWIVGRVRGVSAATYFVLCTMYWSIYMAKGHIDELSSPGEDTDHEPGPSKKVKVTLFLAG